MVRIPIPIISTTLCRVGQDLISRVDLGQTGLCRAITRIEIRMMLPCHGTIGGSNDRRLRMPVNAERSIVVLE
jgi:hypothetical protein